MDPFPTLIPTDRNGELRCGWQATADAPTCGAPATWHVAWWLAPKADFSLVCDAHMTQAQAQFVYAARHPAEMACDMPGTGWLIADPSRCVIATTEDVAARARTLSDPS
jgi:hypothetical protein